MPNIRPSTRRWPSNLDDMRADPSRLVTLGDLARIGLVRTYDTAKKKLPPPLQLPTAPKCWEARTILDAIGLSDAPAPGALPLTAPLSVLAHPVATA
jgi:hypothetical protein